MQYLHSMVRVANLETALEFFCDGLGLIEVSRRDYEKGRFSLVFLAAQGDLDDAKNKNGPMVELTHNWDNEDTYSTGRSFGHLAYRVDDIYELCQSLMDKGIDILRPPRDGHMAFIKSPDGISIELLQKGDSKEPAEPWISMPNQGEW